MLKWLAAPLAFALGAVPLAAQTETVLKEYFEGKTVSPKLAMPGTEDGIDVYPGSPRPLDYPKYASRLKKFGAAIKAGESVSITKIKLKSKHVEFQLGGGGYGTFGDGGNASVRHGRAGAIRRLRATRANEPATSEPGAGSPPVSSQPRGPGSLHKGMLLQEVDGLLGPASSGSERKEGSLKVAERIYSSPNGRVTAWFVEGVLIRYPISSE